MDWRKQTNAKKEELFKDVVIAFGNIGFDKELILEIATKYIHSKRSNLRSKLTKNFMYPRPTWITDQEEIPQKSKLYAIYTRRS